MPNWKKVIVSGSGISQLANDANYLAQSDSAAILSGSFSGSFVGDGSQLSGVTSYTDADTLTVLNTKNVVSGSSQISISSTDGFSAHSASVAAFATGKVNDLSGSIGAVINPLDNRIDAVESSITNLDNSYASDAELSALSSSADGQRKAIQTGLNSDISSLSGSAHIKREAIKSELLSDASSKVSTLSGSAHTQREALKSELDSSASSKVASLSGSAHTQRVALNSAQSSALSSLSGSAAAALASSVTEQSSAYIAADTALSGSAHSQRKAIEADLDGKINTEKGRVDAILSASVADTDTFAEIVDLINSVDTENDTAFAGYVTSSNANQAAIATSVTNLSGSAHTQRKAIESALISDISSANSSATSAVNSLSGSAHIQREALKSELDSSATSKVNSLSGSAHAQRVALDSSISSEQSVQDGRLDSLETFTASLDATFATDAEVSSAVSSLSSSAHTANANLKSTLDSNLNSVSSSAHTERGVLNAARISLANTVDFVSSSAHTQRKAIESSLDGKIDVEKGRIDAILTGSQADKDSFAEIVTLINSVDTENDTAFAGYVTSSNARQTNIETSVTTLSGSAETARQSIKSGLASDISTVDGKANTNASNISTNVSNISTNASGISTNASAITALSSSAEVKREAIKAGLVSVQQDQDGRLGSIEAFTASLDATFATDAEVSSAVSSLSGSAHTQREAIKGALASDISTNASNISSNGTAITTLSGSAHTQREAIKSDLAGDISTNASNISTNAGNISSNASAITSLSSSAEVKREAIKSELASANTALSGSAHTQRKAIESSLDGKIDTEKGRVDAILSASVADTDTFAEIVSLINSVDTENDQAFAGYVTSSNARQTTIESSITTLSGSAAAANASIASDVSTNAGNISSNASAITALSSSAEVKREAIKSELASDISTNATAIANLDNTYATDAALSSTSASFATTIDGLTSDYTELTNIPAGIISSSAQQVAGLVNQEVNLGTGAITASYFKGDGSFLENVTVAQSATVVRDFTNVTSYTVNHNFGDKNILVTVYDSNDYQIFPASIRVFDNTAELTFDEGTTGKVIVGKGGHVVSGSIEFDNIINKPSLVSSSAQVASLFGVTGVSASIDSRIDALNTTVSNLDGNYATDAELAAVSSSFATTVGSISTDFADIANKPTLISGSGQVNITQTEGYSTLAGNVSTNASGISSLSGSAHTQRKAVESGLDSKIDTEKGRIDAILSASVADTDTFAEIVELINSVDTENDAAFGGYVTSSNASAAVQDGRLDSLETFTASIDSTYASENQLNALSSSAEVKREAIKSDLKSDVSTLSGNISTNTSNISTNTSNISTNSSGINTNAGNISTNTGNISTNAGNITSLSGSAHTQRKAIESGLQSSINSNTSAIAALDGNYATDAQLNSVSGALDISIKANESLIAGLDSTYATDASVNSLSGSAHTQRKAIEGTLTGNINTNTGNISTNAGNISTNTGNISTNAGNISTNASNITSLSSSAEVKREAIKSDLASSIGSLSGSAHTQRAALDSAQTSALSSAIGTLSGSAHTANAAVKSELDSSINSLSGSAEVARQAIATAQSSAYIAADTVLSGSAHVQRKAIESSLDSKIDTEKGRVDAILSASVADTDTFAEIVSLINSVDTENDTAFAGYVTSSNANQASIATSVTTLSGSAHSQRVAIKSGLESSISSNAGSISSLSGSAHVQRAALNSAQSSALSSGISSLSSSAEVKREAIKSGLASDITSAVSGLSGSAHVQRKAIESSLAGSISSANSAVTTLSGSAHSQREAIKSSLAGDISTNGGNISTNTGNISTNTSNISTNAGNISTNAGDINTNANSISNNTSDISTNASNITSLSGSAHSQRVALDSSISSEQSVQDGRLSSLETFTASLDATYATDSQVSSAVSGLSGSAHTQREVIKGALASDINTNAGNISTNASGVSTNASGISTNASGISTNSNDISTNTSNISTNSGNISSNASAITSLSGSAHVQRKAIESGLNSTISNLSSTLDIAGNSGTDTVNLKQDSLAVVGTAGEIATTVTNNSIAVGIVNNPTLSGNVTITGNLNVTGDTIQAQVANLNVEDRFILLNSGSSTGDAGIIFGGSDGMINEGSGIFWDSPSNVFGFADGIAADATTATHSSKLGNIQESTSSPTTAPEFQGKGSIHVDTSNEEIWIYS